MSGQFLEKGDQKGFSELLGEYFDILKSLHSEEKFHSTRNLSRFSARQILEARYGAARFPISTRYFPILSFWRMDAGVCWIMNDL